MRIFKSRDSFVMYLAVRIEILLGFESARSQLRTVTRSFASEGRLGRLISAMRLFRLEMNVPNR